MVYRGHSRQAAVWGLNCSVANDPKRTLAKPSAVIRAFPEFIWEHAGKY